MRTAVRPSTLGGRPPVAVPPVTAGGPEPTPGWAADWAAAWDAFWFTPADPLPLAVIRILTGAILAWSCVVWLLDPDAFFGDRGWLRPGEVWRQNDQPWQWSLYFAASSPTMVKISALGSSASNAVTVSAV